jgi:hypothetical protein
MTNDERSPNVQMTKREPKHFFPVFELSSFLRHWIFVIRHFLVVILIFYPALSFAQGHHVKLNESAFAYAKNLIARGNAVVDKRNEWRNDHPTLQQEHDFIRDRGFAEYANWHLGIDATHSQNSKARYKFPFGDFKNIHRCALLAVKSRAHQYGYSDIENAAERLLELMDSRKRE